MKSTIQRTSDSATGRSDEQGWAMGMVDFGDIDAQDKDAARLLGQVVADVKRKAELRDAARIGRSWEPTLGRMTARQRLDQFLAGALLLLFAGVLIATAWMVIKPVHDAGERFGQAIATHGSQGWKAGR